MEKKTLKAGFIGSGFAARFHFAALQYVFSTKVEVAELRALQTRGRWPRIKWCFFQVGPRLDAERHCLADREIPYRRAF